MKTMTKFHHWGPLNTRKNILVIKYLFLIYTLITFGKELTVTQPKKTGRKMVVAIRHTCMLKACTSDKLKTETTEK